MRIFRKAIPFLCAVAFCFSACSTATRAPSLQKLTEEAQTLHVVIDECTGINTYNVVAAFEEAYPSLTVEIEVLPSLRPRLDGGKIIYDTAGLEKRQGILQQHRTAIMAGKNTGDVYLLSGSANTFSEVNGGTLFNDAASLLSAGVLYDMEDMFALYGLTKSDYVQSALAAGSTDDGLFLVPITLNTVGLIGNNQAENNFTQNTALQQAKSPAAFATAFLQSYEQDAGYAYPLYKVLPYALATPPFSPATKENHLTQAVYTQTFAAGEQLRDATNQFPADLYDFSDRVDRGDPVVHLSTSLPTSIVALNAALLQAQQPVALDYIALPNEFGGVTAMVDWYGFVPKGAENANAGAAFLAWLLGDEVQTSALNAQNGGAGLMITSMPVQKHAMAASATSHFPDQQWTLGETFYGQVESLAEKITHTYFLSRYHVELFAALDAWHTGTATLEECIDPLVRQWMLYADE